jgi:hypothetical protein
VCAAGCRNRSLMRLQKGRCRGPVALSVSGLRSNRDVWSHRRQRRTRVGLLLGRRRSRALRGRAPIATDDPDDDRQHDHERDQPCQESLRRQTTTRDGGAGPCGDRRARGRGYRLDRMVTYHADGRVIVKGKTPAWPRCSAPRRPEDGTRENGASDSNSRRCGQTGTVLRSACWRMFVANAATALGVAGCADTRHHWVGGGDGGSLRRARGVSFRTGCR